MNKVKLHQTGLPADREKPTDDWMDQTSSAESLTEAFEEAILQFELNWREEASFAALIASEPVYQTPELFGELACIDLEFRWQAGEQPELGSYLALAAEFGLNSAQLKSLAFEDYRLRSRYGFTRPREAYAEEFKLDVSDWPTWSSPDPEVSIVRKPKNSPNSTTVVRKSGRKTPNLPEPGTNFHGYDLLGILGRGAFGCVYLARQAGLANRFVVLKVSPLSDHEPQLLAALQHTHIVPIYSCDRDEQWQSICMPFLGLVTLAELRPEGARLAESGQAMLSTVAARKADTVAASTRSIGTLPAEINELLQPDRHSRLPAIRGMDCQRSLLWMFARVAEALDFAHSRGVVHGDIKPANILVSDDGNPLLLDFHLASGGETSSGPKYIGGTLPYMSPQQLRSLEDNQPIDTSSDLFSLGVVMYELLGGRLPYPTLGEDCDSCATMIRQREQPPAPLGLLNRLISKDVESIVHACLASNAAARYQSARQLQEDLDAHLTHRPLRYAPNRSLAERAAKWTRRHPALTSAWSLTGVFTAVLLALGLFVGERLQSAKKLEATAASQKFVEGLEANLLPLAIPGMDSNSAEQSRERLLAQIAEYYRQTGSYKLECLSPEQLAREQEQLTAAAFWWGRSALASLGTAGTKPREAELAQLREELAEVIRTLPAPIAADFKDLGLLFDDYSAMPIAIESWQKRFQESEWVSAGKESIASEILAAAQAMSSQNWQQALESLDKALARDADNYQAWLLKGHACLAAGKKTQALEAYSFCTKLQPSSPWGWFQRGVVRLEQGDFQGSLADFTQCIQLEPKEPTAWLNRALAAQGCGQLELAASDLSEAIELGCSETRAWYLRHLVHQQLGHAEEAEADLRKFLELEPSDLKSWLTRGLAHAKVNQPERAIADFEMSVRIAPESVDAWQNLAMVQNEMLQEEELAIEALGKVLSLRPADPKPLATRGVLRARAGRRDEAVADARAALELKSDADTLFRAAGVFSVTSQQVEKDRETAFELLKAAAYREPEYVLSRLEANQNFEALRQHPEYQRTLASLRQLAGQPDASFEVKQ
ncbi:MAG: protein kinase domain-containing protein [Planctomycetota bacterium]